VVCIGLLATTASNVICNCIIEWQETFFQKQTAFLKKLEVERMFIFYQQSIRCESTTQTILGNTKLMKIRFACCRYRPEVETDECGNTNKDLEVFDTTYAPREV
jgi:hypothetical protein